jgi:hypothetical protein
LKRPLPISITAHKFEDRLTLGSVANQQVRPMGADCQPVSADEDLTLGVVNCADGETGAVVLRGEADRDSGIRCQESGGRSEQ